MNDFTQSEINHAVSTATAAIRKENTKTQSDALSPKGNELEVSEKTCKEFVNEEEKENQVVTQTPLPIPIAGSGKYHTFITEVDEDYRFPAPPTNTPQEREFTYPVAPIKAADLSLLDQKKLEAYRLLKVGEDDDSTAKENDSHHLANTETSPKSTLKDTLTETNEKDEVDNGLAGNPDQEENSKKEERMVDRNELRNVDNQESADKLLEQFANSGTPDLPCDSQEAADTFPIKDNLKIETSQVESESESAVEGDVEDDDDEYDVPDTPKPDAQFDQSSKSSRRQGDLVTLEMKDRTFVDDVVDSIVQPGLNARMAKAMNLCFVALFTVLFALALLTQGDANVVFLLATNFGLCITVNWMLRYQPNDQDKLKNE